MIDITTSTVTAWIELAGHPFSVAILTTIICYGIHLLWEKTRHLNSSTKADAHYKDAQRLAHIGHWEYFFDTNHLIWSDEVYRIFGLSKKDFDNTLEGFYSLIHPDDREKVRVQYNQAIKNNENYEAVHRIIRKDGQIAYVQEHCHTYFDNKGRARRSLGTIQDVTVQEVAENELRRAKHEAESATRAKSAFLATMSHEIRTPLNGILGMLQLLATTSLDKEQKEYVNWATTSSERLSDLLFDILELTELATNRIEISRELFNIHETVSGVVEIFSNKAKQKGLLLQLNINDNLPTMILGDEARLRHVLFNLIGNAVKFTEHGNVSVDVTALSDHSNATLPVLFIITDTGPGIPDEIMHMMVEPFTQAEDAMVRKHGGAGLGLSIVQGLSKLMAGTLAISTDEGMGTEIYLCLPLETPGDSHAASLVVHPPPVGQHGEHKVLLVEDDAVNQTALSTLLRKQGLHVDIAQNGQEALEKIRSENHRLIFMDIQMPIMDGMEATHAIREGQAGTGKSDIPIIALTAYAMAGDRKRFLQAGMNDYLPKPVSIEGLQKVLDREIGQRVNR
nr:response regulator [uncultured Pseudodesulfovibrio sp.]